MINFPASRLASLRSRRMVGGTLAPHVPWQVMVYLADSMMDGGYAGGALISDRWVLTAGRNLFVRKNREDIQGKDPKIPKVYVGISRREEAGASKGVAVEKVGKTNSILGLETDFNLLTFHESFLLSLSL